MSQCSPTYIVLICCARLGKEIVNTAIVGFGILSEGLITRWSGEMVRLTRTFGSDDRTNNQKFRVIVGQDSKSFQKFFSESLFANIFQH